ncbi:MAG: sn-glycerol-3-phosphate ABC transporter ATP-binding protein UgpC [Burkholderiales bacterium]|nr:sn-glycerol-3-phosphate ABC transporter ATP-binding protein UgpC [Burkholderiales bacterium]MDE2565447.1 sn-glycerol-3-phosphate ABC transporter ATP-binding protein UgpC [Burkholderiales bacterium]
MAQVELRGVGKSYDGKITIVHAIDLEIRHGEFVVFVGPSGCGKSTLLRMMAGLEPISAGELRIAGRRVNELPPRERDIAMVFQDYALYPHKTLYENMAFGLRLRKTPEAEIERRVLDAARLLRIEPMLQRRPAALSGGQRQRVAIGRAIVREPAVFLFDEPLSNLDAQLRNEMRSEIKRLHQRLGATIVYVTHDQTEAMTLADRIAVLSAGRLMQYDTPDAIYHRPAAQFVAGFTGAPPMNLAPCTVSGTQADLGGLQVELPAALAGRARGRGALTFGVRPENLLLTPAATAALRLPARVSLLEPLGAETLVTLRLGQTEMVARGPASFRQAPDTALEVYVDPQHLHLFDAASGAAI